jgi:hypothetical protein
MAAKAPQLSRVMCKARQAVGRWRAGRHFPAQWTLFELSEAELKCVKGDPVIDVRDADSPQFKAQPSPKAKQAETQIKGAAAAKVKAMAEAFSLEDLIKLAVSEQIAVPDGAQKDEIAAALIERGILA